MNKFYSIILSLSFSLVVCTTGLAQHQVGIATGNYGGVSSLGFNPSSIVDSRFKVDINLISFSSYFDNNLFDIKRDALVSRRFFKPPYNSNYNSVRAELITLTPGMANTRVNMQAQNRIQFPASMMISVGKQSAIALNLQSRVGMQAFDVNRSTATLLVNNLQDQRQYAMVQDNSGINFNYLRWQEVGLTYGTVLYNRKAHFLKGAFTGKWLIGQSAAHIQSDNVQVQFQSANQLSLQSPLIRYYRTENADVKGLGINSFFRDVEDKSFGWDLGFTYEFRGKFDRFKYVGENDKVKDRRDLNKYALRLGVALVDVGKFSFNKKRSTNDHAVNINNYNFSNVKANSFDDWDTAYSRLVQYAPNASSSFDMSLPTALTANVDVHLFNGFYVNAALYQPVERKRLNTQTAFQPVRWYAVTPRLETRYFGLYIPVVVTPMNDRTNVGATLRLGPLFLGSNNLGTYLFNEKLPSIDVHAGLKIGITYGRPSRFLRKMSGLVRGQSEDEIERADQVNFKDTSILYAQYRAALDSIRSTSNVVIKAQQDNRAPLVNVIVNNYLGGTAQGAVTSQSKSADTVMVSNTISAPNNMTATRVDTAFQRKDAEIDFLIRRVAESEMRLQQLEQKRIADSIAIRNAPAKPAAINNIRPTPTQQRAAQPGSTTIIQQRPVTQPSGSVRIVERQVAAPNSPAVIVQPPVNYNQEQLNRMYNRNDDLEQQIKMLRAEMAASANAASRAPGARVDTVRRVITDTAIIMDTVVIRDTVRVGVAPKPTPSSSKGEVNTVQNLIYDPVYFATGSNALSPAALRVLERVAGDYNKRPYNNKVQLTGRTDSMGSPEVNRQLAQRRIASVRNYLQENGFPNQQIISETQPDVSATPRPNAEKRRVDIEIR